MTAIDDTIELIRSCGVTSPVFRGVTQSQHPIQLSEIDPSGRGTVTLNPKTGTYVINQVRIAEYLRDLGYRYLDGVCYFFDGRYLKSVDPKELEDEIISSTRIVDEPPMVTRKVTQDIMAYWSSISTPKNVECNTPSATLDKDYRGWLIPFENGIYKVDEDRLVPFCPDVLFTSHIHAEFRPNIEDEELERLYLNIFCDRATLEFFYLAVGYTLYSDVLNPPAIFVLQGGGKTGKSAILHVLECLIGSDKVSNLGLDKLSEQFGPYRLRGMVANLCDEAGNRGSRFTKVNGDMLKAISAGRPWEIERKYKDVEQYTNKAKLWFAANSTPNFGDTSSGMMRRLFIFPCKNLQSDKDMIYSKMDSSKGRAWLAFKALEAFMRFRLSGECEFFETDYMKSEKEIFRCMDSVSDFIQEEVGSMDPDDIRNYFHRKSTVETYSEYRACALSSGWDSPLKKGTFISQICTEYRMNVRTFYAPGDISNTTYRGFNKQDIGNEGSKEAHE